MTTHLKSLIATAKTANKTIEYDHQTKVRRINALKKRRYELLSASRSALNQIDTAIRDARQKNYDDRHHDAGG